jgi:DNA-binding NarL/FixJ family response regulator
VRPRVVVADDNPDVSLQVVSVLRIEFDVVATAKNGQLAIECVRDYNPDIIVLDLEMPILNGIEVTRELRKAGPTPAVVICSVQSDPEIIEAAQQAGALGYVFKMRVTRDLIMAVRSAAVGEPFISSS